MAPVVVLPGLPARIVARWEALEAGSLVDRGENSPLGLVRYEVLILLQTTAALEVIERMT